MRTQIKYYEYYEPGSDLHINQKLGLANSRSRSLRGYFLLITNIKKYTYKIQWQKLKKKKKLYRAPLSFSLLNLKGGFFTFRIVLLIVLLLIEFPNISNKEKWEQKHNV